MKLKQRKGIIAVTGGEPISTTFGFDMSHSVWQSAVMAADEDLRVEGDRRHEGKRFLAELLLTEEEVIPADGQILLKDFVLRYQLNGKFGSTWTTKQRTRLAEILALCIIHDRQLKKKVGRPATPIYETSELDARIDCAVAEYHAFRRHFPKASKAEIVEKVAALNSIDPRTLHDALGGTRSIVRRQEKRRAKIIKGGVS